MARRRTTSKSIRKSESRAATKKKSSARRTATRKTTKRRAHSRTKSGGRPTPSFPAWSRSGPLRVLCVHGVGNHSTNLDWQAEWREAVVAGVHRWNPAADVHVEFVMYDDIFDAHPLGPTDVAEALVALLGSGLFHGIGDLFRAPGSRGLFDLPERVRWTAGMVVQWTENPSLRREARRRVAQEIERFDPHVVAAHSLGSLIAYDTLIDPATRHLARNRVFVSLGSQIGNPFVRSTFGGRIVPIDAYRWFHLFNTNDDVFTAEVRVEAETFEQVHTEFELPGVGDHDAVEYLTHRNTIDRVWFSLAGREAVRSRETAHRAMARAVEPPTRRALLVGINDYPSEADRLEGCVNDAFLMSSVLQECGFDPEDIRLVLDDRATADGIRKRLHWLLDGVKEGDERVFYYSGHGAQMHAYGAKEEIDRIDECLVAHDFDWSVEKAIVDDELFELYSQLPYGAQFMIFLDCCHSGGMTRDGASRVRGITPPDDIRHRALRWDASIQMWIERELESPNRSLAAQEHGEDYLGDSGAKFRLGRAVALRRLSNTAFDAARKAYGHHGPYLPMIIQACQEDEFAYEYRHGVTSYGAFTYSMASVLRQTAARGRTISYQRLVNAVEKQLDDLGYDQKPQLTGPRTVKSASIPFAQATSRSKSR